MLPGIDAKAYYKEVERPPEIPADSMLEASGVRIGRIDIQAANIFDTAAVEDNTLLFRLGNLLHYKTRESTIGQQLLFSRGDVYDGRKLAESERLLRDRTYLYDARIRPVRMADGSVDIEVSTRDVWTFKPGIAVSRAGGKDTVALEFEEINLLGSGSRLRLSNKTGVDRDSASFFFRDPNLGNSWWDLSLGYSENSDGDSSSFDLNRPFYAIDTRSAHGVSASKFDRIDSRYDLGEVVDQYFVAEKDAELYFGWSSGYQQGWTARYRVGITHDERDFQPVSGALNTQKLPPNRKLVYPWISYERLQDEYQKDHNRDQINRTEDIALGWRFSGLLGLATPEISADRHSVIFETSVRKGVMLSEHRSLLWSSSLNGRYEERDWADVLLSGQLRYHHRYSPQRLFYLGLGGDTSNNLDADSQVLLGGDNGLRGYPLRYQSGEARWLLTIEQRFFSSWYPFRLFNVGGAIFADIGETLGSNNHGSQPLGILKDIGFGFRVGNARSGLGSVIHFDFAFPLDGNGQVDDFQFLIQTKNSF